jgi:hypothetical protein
MKRLLLVAALIYAAALLVPSQAAAIIQLERGISGVRLGDTKAEVREDLGKPRRIFNRSGELGRFTQFRYRGRITVTFFAGNTVTSVATAGPGDRTARGVGVGSTRRQVRNRVPDVRCLNVPGPGPALAFCDRGQRRAGGPITAFHIRNGRVFLVTVGFVID